jgi:hypothetical protein
MSSVERCGPKCPLLVQLLIVVRLSTVKTTQQYSTQPAAHSQDTNTGRGKGEDGDCERRRGDGDLPFPKLKSRYYYWSLIILIYLTEYLSNNKQGKLGMGT